MGYKSKQDLSALENYFKDLNDLGKKEVEYGYYDQPHYSGLNMATLAAIHEQGWHNLPERNFMYSTSISFRPGQAMHLKRIHRALVQRKPVEKLLNQLGKDGAESIKMTIDQGSFSNPKVSRDWASVKGFSDALIHYGDLRDAATYRIVKSQGD